MAMRGKGAANDSDLIKMGGSEDSKTPAQSSRECHFVHEANGTGLCHSSEDIDFVGQCGGQVEEVIWL